MEVTYLAAGATVTFTATVSNPDLTWNGDLDPGQSATITSRSR
jgi:hypothetical protein